jgi:hypothetical protein
MAGLVPAIHGSEWRVPLLVDGRIKSGHDEEMDRVPASKTTSYGSNTAKHLLELKI